MKKYPQQHQGSDSVGYLPEQGQKTALYTFLAISVLATGYSAYSQYENGKAIKRLNDFNAAQNEQDALTAQRDASIKANQVRAQNKRVLAKQRAAFAANGIVGETGSPLLVQAEQAGYLELGALETQREGSLAAGGLRQQAVLDRLAGNSALRAGKMQATGTILSGAASAAGGAYGARGSGGGGKSGAGYESLF